MNTRAVLGGTFDHLHIGHKALLSFGARHASSLVIGITDRNLVQDKQYAFSIQGYAERTWALSAFFRTELPSIHVEYHKIHDMFGTTLLDTSLRTIIATPMTESGAHKVNTERVKRGLAPLEVLVCPMVRDEEGEHVSSTHIRAGMIDRDGHVYRSLFTHPLYIQKLARTILQKPWGRLYTTFPKEILLREHRIIAVGDGVTQTCMDNGIDCAVAYCDNKERNRQIAHTFSSGYAHEKTHILNPAGTLSPQAASHVIAQCSTLFSCRQCTVFDIEGEEDLLTLPAMLCAPLGAVVIYGYPFLGGGVCVVRVTEAVKKRIYTLLNRHTS
ncbi:MAG: pantetheine-phosphate adenylyltransferase [Candidatus Pacebacteria bacterium]|nr:pantetheine-phosphate adenylyltransferase [Candidatus Paceibacterota bacterium]